MPKPKHSEFRVRMSPDLMALIDEARGSRSKNEQINDWLWSKAKGDRADRMADALRPLLATMSEDDQAALIDHTIMALDVLARKRAKKRQRNTG